MLNNRWRVGFIAGLGMLCLSFNGLAAGAGEPPSPGAVQQTLPQKQKKPPAGRLPAQSKAPPAIPKAPPGGPKIHISRFEITGNSVISTSELQSVVAKYLGRDLTLLQIYDIADKLTRYYRNKGYTVASVTVPAQKIKNGVVHFEVIEGRIGKIHFKGNTVYSDTVLRKQLDSLQSGKVLDNADLEREVLLLNDMPGLASKVVIMPGSQFGQSDLLFRSRDRRFDATVGLNNYGRREVGGWRAQADFAVNDPFGYGDGLDLSVLHGQGGQLDYGRLAYNFPVDSNGTRASVSASRYVYHVKTSDLGAAFTGTTLKGDGDYFDITVTHPWIRSRRQNLVFGVGINRTITHQHGTLALPGTGGANITLADFSVLWNRVHADGHAVTTVAADVATNFTGNGGGPKDSGQPLRLEVDATHLRNLLWGWDLYLRARAVYSVDPLVDTQKYRIGGPNSVRAYPTAEASGDMGADVSVELQYPFTIEHVTSGRLRAFWDGGYVHRKIAGPEQDHNDSLTGAGAGLSFHVTSHVNVDVMVAGSTSAAPPSDGDNGVRAWLAAYGSF